ncbi:ABC transporter substrate-binding protein [Thiohalocapsa marina]|uniref:ABC transporter substrate-binding protein n=1 Tax=Thiohalocapsa marina TaxID=424902 RepID=A0A5M8FQW0_9GAMM|nr:ABC transporter substrate-binding protein [Thiohalocapsa marina]KAA6186610.1 ABC transporter substrate-binding protein [Thiohalocapsa marina]
MQMSRTGALAIAGLGLALLIAGPLLPGGERLIRNGPPQGGHVTDLARAADGSVLAGTQDGALWRLAEGRWSRINLDLGGQPVTALPAGVANDLMRAPIGTAGGLINGPPGLPPLRDRVSDQAVTDAGLVVATGDGLQVAGDGRWQTALPGVQVYRLGVQPANGSDYLHAGTIGQGVFSARVEDLRDWIANADGLPAASRVYSFAVTAGGRLIAGTDHGLYWQTAPQQPWRMLRVGLEDSRILSLLLEPAVDAGTQPLWIGSDSGLYRVDLTEHQERVAAAAYAVLVDAPPEHLRYGISWILPQDDGVLFSAGDVYQYGEFGLKGWYWISLAGLLLVLAGGWLFPARAAAAQDETGSASGSRAGA